MAILHERLKNLPILLQPFLQDTKSFHQTILACRTYQESKANHVFFSPDRLKAKGRFAAAACVAIWEAVSNLAKVLFQRYMSLQNRGSIGQAAACLSCAKGAFSAIVVSLAGVGDCGFACQLVQRIESAADERWACRMKNLSKHLQEGMQGARKKMFAELRKTDFNCRGTAFSDWQNKADGYLKKQQENALQADVGYVKLKPYEKYAALSQLNQDWMI